MPQSIQHVQFEKGCSPVAIQESEGWKENQLSIQPIMPQEVKAIAQADPQPKKKKAKAIVQPKKQKAKPTNTCAEWLVLLIKELIGTQTLDELGIILDFKHKMITIDEIELPMQSITDMPRSKSTCHPGNHDND